MVVLGTGASEKDGLKESERLGVWLWRCFKPFRGSSEPQSAVPASIWLTDCRYTLRYLWAHWSELSHFEPLRQVPLDEARALLEASLVLDTSTQNTDQEVYEGLRVPRSPFTPSVQGKYMKKQWKTPVFKGQKA